MHTLQCLYLSLSLCDISQLLGVACISALSAFFISLFFLQKMPFAVELEEERTERACLKALKAKMRRHFTHALGKLMLDHSTALKSAISWSFFWVLIVAIPVISFFKVTAADGHQLPFARLVLLLETGEDMIAYISFWQMLTRHKEPVGEELEEGGLAELDNSDFLARKGDRERSSQEKKDAQSPPLSSNGSCGSSDMEKAPEKKSFFVIFFKSIKRQPVQIQATYLNNLQNLHKVVLIHTWPFFLLHLSFKIAVYTTTPLNVPAISGNHDIDLAITFVLTSLSWMYRTTTLFFVCVVFAKTCKSQEIIMKNYMLAIIPTKPPAISFELYFDIVEGLCAISHRFRKFLVFSGMLSIVVILVSMYSMVSSRDITLISYSDIIMVNLVGLAGSSVCLVSASKIAHLHSKIVETAAIMHSERTYGIQKLNAPTVSGKSLSHLEASSSNTASEDKQREWMERVTLKTYLSATTAGISVYGFVLDRTFVHTSFGVLLTTTLFVLSRSLEALKCACSNVCPPAAPPSNHPPTLGLQFPY